MKPVFTFFFIVFFSASSALAQQSSLVWDSYDVELNSALLLNQHRNSASSFSSFQGDDIDFDSIGDFFAIGEDPSAGLQAISGATGETIWRQTFPSLYSPLYDTLWAGARSQFQDLDSDGISDIVLEVIFFDSNIYAFENYLVAVSSSDGSLLWVKPSPPNHSNFISESMVVTGDVNGDGVADLLYNQNDRISCVDSMTGNSLWEVDTASSSYSMFYYMGLIDDLDGDGLSDLAFIDIDNSNPGGRALCTMSAASGNTIWATNHDLLEQAAIVALVDMDNDAVKDIVVSNRASSNGYDHNGGITVYSAASGNPLWSVVGTDDFQNWSTSDYFSAIGDINQDGFNDILMNVSGVLSTLSGKDGNAIWTSSYVSGYFVNGPSLFADFDNDGVNDVLADNPGASSNGLSSNGTIGVVSGATGTVIWSLSGSENDSRLDVLADAPDSDGDGHPELFVYEIKNNTGGTADAELTVLSAFDGALAYGPFSLSEVFNYPNSAYTNIDILGDLTGDGLQNFAIQEVNYADPSLSSATKVYSFKPSLKLSSHQISSSTGGAVDFEIDFGPAYSSYEYRMLMSLTSGTATLNSCSIDMGVDSWLVKTYLGQWPSVFQNTSGLLDTEGKALMQLATNRAPASLVGRTVYFASIARLPWDGWSKASNTAALEVVQ